jgi:hypothetical protein
MSCVPDTGPGEARSFDEADRASQALPQQIEKARQVLRDYRDALEVSATEGVSRAPDGSGEKPGSPDLHRGA